MANYQNDKVIFSVSEVLRDARESLRGHWGDAAVMTLVYFLVSVVASFTFGASLIISGPLALGLAIYYLKLIRRQSPKLQDIFEGFQDFARSLVAWLLMMVAIMVGMLLLIVPGIIVALGLSQTYYILRDNKELSAVDAMKESWEVMNGYKGKLFVLYLSFIPWAILNIFTLFIGTFWLVPYMYTSVAEFYERIKFVDKPAELLENFGQTRDSEFDRQFGRDFDAPMDREL